MGNIVSYLKWRGDISLAERPFGEVDNLVLSELAYVDFSGIVPSSGEGNYSETNNILSLQNSDSRVVFVDWPAASCYTGRRETVRNLAWKDED